MYRDLKLGLALGVLLIGSVAAFFFRNGRDADAGLPKLEQPERLDAELAERAVAPYLGDLEAEPSAAVAAMIDDGDWATPTPLFGTPRNVSAVSRAFVTPDPISLASIATPAAASSPAPPADEAIIPPMALPAGPVGPRTHVVKAGETLSGIAYRYLGSAARFGEIFAANSDKLARPESLRVGMELLIPAPAENTVKTEAPDEPATDAVAAAPEGETDPRDDFEEAPILPPIESSAPTLATPDPPATPVPAKIDEAKEPSAAPSPGGGKMFVPARRAPFMPGRYRAPASVQSK